MVKEEDISVRGALFGFEQKKGVKRRGGKRRGYERGPLTEGIDVCGIRVNDITLTSRASQHKTHLLVYHSQETYEKKK